MNYREAVDYIGNVPRFNVTKERALIEKLMRRLGDPQKAFRVIHVAGTNGKGSVCAYLAQILQESGIRTGLFTSPHLIRINERFQVDRKEIDDETFARLFTQVMDVVNDLMEEGEMHPTFMVLIFAVGMLYFREKHVETAILETGLGGRLDVTNIVEKPEVCVITSIGMDHMKQLGSTIEEIAGEKAGILKEGVPVVYDASDRAAAAVIHDKAVSLGIQAVPVYPLMTRVLEYTDKKIAFILNNRYYDNVYVQVSSPAEYQVMDAALAMTAVRLYDKDRLITQRMITDAVSHVFWEGRMERIEEDVYVDGAHNEPAIRAFVKTANHLGRGRKRVLLFGVSADKDYRTMIRILMEESEFSCIITTRFHDKRAEKPEVLADCFRSCGAHEVISEDDPGTAYDLAVSQKGDGILFCAGSLYLVGELKELHNKRHENTDMVQ